MKLDFTYGESFRPGYAKDDEKLNAACYLCGGTEELTIEHVAPKILFKSINPGKYIRLMACASCNKAKGKNDEYIGRLLQGTAFNAHAEIGISEGKRGHGEGHGVGIYKDHVSRSVVAPTIVVDDKRKSSSKIAVPIDRLEEFQITIAKGLWTILSNNIFNWNDYKFLAETDQLLANPGALNEVLVEAEKDARYSQEWSGVFKYSGDFASDEVSFWILRYYDIHIGTVVIAKKH